MLKVITYGTFDCFHYGHYNLLKRCAELGDHLIVGVSSDEMCRKKGKIPILDENKRMEIVKSLRFVDEVLLERDMRQKVDDIKNLNVQKFVLGSDYCDIFPKMPEYNQLTEMGCEVVFLPRTPDISTSQLKEKMMEQVNLDADKDSLHNITNK